MSGVIEHTKVLLEEAQRGSAASSCTFYVRDPWWTNEFRLLHMPGVQVAEPMYGFLLSSKVRRITSGEEELFIGETAQDERLRDRLEERRRLRSEREPLFGDFVCRECVASCARFVHRLGGVEQAFLFVNYQTPQTFAEPCRQQLRTLWRQLSGLYDELAAELRQVEPAPGAQLIRILRPIEMLALGVREREGTEDLLKDFFGFILDSAMEAFGVTDQEGFGSIHLYRPDKGRLEPAASRGGIGPLPDIDLSEGKGIISWVAHTHRSLLIGDLSQSRFRDMQVPVLANASSQVAVPLLVGEQCIGVLNLESSRPLHFKPHELRALGYAASQAAIAYQLAQQANSNRRLVQRTASLLDVAHRAVAGTGGARESLEECLKEIARLACEWSEASHCDIWLYDVEQRAFREGAATYPLKPHHKPRPDGWSKYVLDRQTPVWISDLEGVDRFRCCLWDRPREAWEAIETPATSALVRVNDLLLGTTMRCGLGIPIMMDGRCLGLIWLKFEKSRPEPSPSTVGLASGFADNAGLVIDFLSRAEKKYSQPLEEFTRNLLPTSFPDHRGLQVYVESRPCEGQIGGDFYAFQSLEEDHRRVGILIGDGEGHGTLAALRMLPVYTTFRNFFKESSSTKYVLEKLIQTSADLKVDGSALYFVIDFEEAPPLLFASSAGHESLIVIKKKNLKIEDVPAPASPGVHYRLGVVSRPARLAEAVHELATGDLIIAYTDGISEAGRETGTDLFGRHRIESTALENFYDEPKVIGEAIFRRAVAHAGGRLSDDATVLVLRVTKAL